MARIYQLKRFLRVRAKLITIALLITLLINLILLDWLKLLNFPSSPETHHIIQEKNNGLDYIYGNDTKIHSLTAGVVNLLGNSSYQRSSCHLTIRDFEARYLPLRNSTKKYFLAANLKDNEAVIPSIMEQVTRLILFLGPDRVDVSISENDSKDKSRPLLDYFERHLNALGVKTFFTLSTRPSEYKKRNRIEVLAELRNEALGPFYANMTAYDEIIFINDVFFCADDVLELLHQHSFQNSHMTCGMDFFDEHFNYYDSWVGRSMSGNMLINNPSAKLFSYDESDQDKYYRSKPIQVFSCWNGMAILDPRPFREGIRFRVARLFEGECGSSECQLLAKDFWQRGYGRILLAPHIGFVYQHHLQRQTRARKLAWLESTIYENGNIHSEVTDKVEWKYPGPPYVLCYSLNKTDARGPDYSVPYLDVMQYPNEPKV